MMSPSAAPDLADQFHQFRHLNALQRAHRSLNVRAQALVSAAAHKPFEFGGYLVPRERPRRKPGEPFTSWLYDSPLLSRTMTRLGISPG